jgi:hypothetical protein
MRAPVLRGPVEIACRAGSCLERLAFSHGTCPSASSSAGLEDELLVDRADHFESVAVLHIELDADIGDFHALFGLGRILLVRGNCEAVDMRERKKPSIGLAGKCGLGFRRKLIFPLNPVLRSFSTVFSCC